ncbi:MAG TPA: ShlB/FhaC/HecB family hemolysin secretion/activation protein [Gemmatimonadales bacterium]|nr:ShlB/FhaC/HecB family hemolysin secretion/activation protein [Gemmatimonadales bacterium]
MGAHFLALALIASAPQQGADSQRAFASPRTEALVRLAMARHAEADTTVHDYQATFRTRLTFSFGRRRWARIPPLAAEEQTGIIRWQRPNDLQIEMRGRRNRARDRDMDIRSVFDEPWFVPRALDDSVRLAGADFPEQAALHPLAKDGPDWYRYTLVDSVAVATPDGHAVWLYRVSAEPRRSGVGLIVGYLVLDGQTGDVVRLSFRFVGTDLWIAPDSATPEDSSDARTANKWINRLLSLDADLEYSLQDRKHWMPYRQTISGSVEIPFVSDVVIPFAFTTTFDDYEIDTGRPIVFRTPRVLSKAAADSFRAARWDSLQAARLARGDSSGADPDTLEWRKRAQDIPGVWGQGGRYEVHLPPMDSLDHYAGWTDSMQLDLAEDDSKEQRELAAQVAGLAEGLEDSITGRRSAMFAVEQIADVFRYNRVQGVSLGFGYRTPFFDVPFTTAFGGARLGLSDTRLYLRGAIIRDAPSGRWTFAGYRDLATVDPFVRIGAFANSLNALFTTHDEADYLLVQGGSITRETSPGLGVDLTLAARVEDQGSVTTEAHSALHDLYGDGRFAANPPVTEGVFAGATIKVEHRLAAGRWVLGADVLGGEPGTTAKLFAEVRQRLGRGRSGLTLTARGGMATDDPLPQSAFRLGGQGTVRGYPYGAIQGQGFWSVQADLGFGKKSVRPVLFADAGQAGPRQGFFDREVLSGAGAGLSFFGGIVRFDLSVPITPETGDPRFDLVFIAPR